MRYIALCTISGRGFHLANKPRPVSDLLTLTILALLAEKPCHPYEMQRLIRSRGKDFAIAPTRSLYHAVDRLVRDQWIEAAETQREGKRPERTVYRITETGREEFDVWLNTLICKPVLEYPLFVAALSFLPHLSMEAGLKALQIRSIELEGQIADWGIKLKAWKQHLPRLLLVEGEYTLAMQKAELEWIRSLIDDIETGKLPWTLEGFSWVRNDDAASAKDTSVAKHDDTIT
jgi:DNA-binding PadR family transcriptional regulator